MRAEGSRSRRPSPDSSSTAGTSSTAAWSGRAAAPTLDARASLSSLSIFPIHHITTASRPPCSAPVAHSDRRPSTVSPSTGEGADLRPRRCARRSRTRSERPWPQRGLPAFRVDDSATLPEVGDDEMTSVLPPKHSAGRRSALALRHLVLLGFAASSSSRSYGSCWPRRRPITTDHEEPARAREPPQRLDRLAEPERVRQPHLLALDGELGAVLAERDRASRS